MAKRCHRLQCTPFFLFAVIAAVSAYILGLHVFIVNAGMMSVSSKKILSPAQAPHPGSFDCIIVPGASVRSGNLPSPMLEQRLAQGIFLYRAGYAPKLLMSGDHASDNYDEVKVMKNYAVGKGIPSQDIFMDHAGLSTYETVFRAKHVFHSESNIIVSQKYHLYRSVYIARELGLNTYGVAAGSNRYKKQAGQVIREICARYKDFYLCVIRFRPDGIDGPVPIYGDGDKTNKK